MGIRQRNLLLICLICPLLSLAQKGGPVVFTVDKDTVWGAEFERVFSKNNRNPDKKPSIEELQEYEDLYVKFKLKVKEAYRLGMDTNADYKKELAGYRKQLAQPYLTDKTVTEKLVEEAYERSKYEVDASNLMIYLSPVASPEDTLAAWKRINHWRDLIVSGKYSFEQLTRDSSTDEHGKKEAGRLGYFTVFNMIYPFETQAYNTPVGEVSQPFRTQYGYHLLKVHDKRPARGEVQVAHILIRINNEAEYDTMKPRIDAIYQKLQQGEKWEDLVFKYSEDFNTRERGGTLNWIKSIGGNVPADFREAAFALKDGEFSKPVKTELGWHIIYRKEHRPNPSFEDSKEAIKMKITRDSRSELNRSAVLARVKKENDYKINQKNWNTYIANIDSSAINGQSWIIPDALRADSTLFTIGKKKFNYGAFNIYVQQNPARNVNAKQHVERLFAKYADDMNLTYEESILEQKYDDFKYLMQEYRDGILLFELTNDMVWTKATEDTTGLKEFFAAHQQNYQWQQRAGIRIYTCNSAKTEKKLMKGLKKNISDADLKAKLNKKDPLALKIQQKIIEHGRDSAMDAQEWTVGLHTFTDAGNPTVLRIDSLIAPGPKTLKEAMGPATSDYQKYLEDQWIQELKGRYKVVINPNALSQLFQGKP
ncbi:MAG: peptidylprolyl isomerase [Bacteroidetes bacterium]|nr:peptidylprolyl isomerase [Bacteroidota bacterium]